tara:strand:+ start:45 stop:1835 length:1791 start_codon:yes stop_codon:yes gene_type:complete
VKEGYIKKKSATIPFGYELSEIEGYLAPIQSELDVLHTYIKSVEQEEYSLRKAAELISEETGRKLSHVGLSKIIKKQPALPNKYQYSPEQKRKQKLARDKKELAKVKKKIAYKENKISVEHEVLKKATEKTTSKIVTETELEQLSPSMLEILKESKIIFHPNDGPQTDFLAASEKDVLYGGAAGGGKSYAMLVDPLRYAHKKAHRALILRRSMPELREMIDKSRELYPQAFPGAKFKEVEKLWNFPSGAQVHFGFLERDADVYRYQGQAYSWIGFDEITHLPTEFSWNYLASRLRTTDPEIQTYLRCTANPGGVGSHWVKKRYIEPQEHNKSFEGKDGLTRKFIPAKLSDNPYLDADGVYEQMLKSLPPTQRQQLLEGNWDVAEGAAFTEFEPLKHVITPFALPVHWERVKGIDYGYASESCCLWGIMDMNDGTLIIYRELYRKGLTGEELGSIITDMEAEDPFSVNGVLDTAAWANTGTTGPTVGESLVRAGHKLRRADKNRIQGKVQLHEYLKVRENGRPKLQIFNTCPNLIRELQSIPLSKSNPEDVDTHASDHAYDALRYMIMSRPRMESPLERMRGLKREIYRPIDSTFGY